MQEKKTTIEEADGNVGYDDMDEAELNLQTNDSFLKIIEKCFKHYLPDLNSMVVRACYCLNNKLQAIRKKHMISYSPGSRGLGH